ncbi:OmpA family protein [Fibrella arboris]|uniref:OmpA family protein n=1 Tax=Fibrella arboris TaxID=3242486 RepID=UPI0035230720
MLTRILVILGVFASFCAQAQAVEYSTPRPRVDDANGQSVVINRIDLTAQYTIIYLRFRERSREGSTIEFVSSARLYANDGSRSFKFIRADNIPIDEMRRKVKPGEEVDFVAYFERLDPGIQTFDLFECSDRNRPGITCFNFWGVHVTNPLKRQQRTPPQSPQKPASPRQVPRPTPAKPAPEPVQPPAQTTPTLAIKGVVRDAKTGKPMVATITYRLLSGAETYSHAAPDSIRSTPQEGAYQIPGDALTVWDVAVSARGYFGQRDTISINLTEKTVNFELAPIVAGAKITLTNIYFEQSKYELQAESFPELDRLVALMRQNPTMTIRLEGHTDIIGDFDKNLALSRNRVQSVKQYLTSKGIAAARVEATGYGHSRPINSTPGKPHPENRRVEMVITKV